jgi:hypothetical protein
VIPSPIPVPWELGPPEGRAPVERGHREPRASHEPCDDAESPLAAPGAVYPDGRVCISILHAPGNDPNGYEQASERWSPIQTVETIMLSIISMLSSPNDESPANIDAAVRAHPPPLSLACVWRIRRGTSWDATRAER